MLDRWSKSNGTQNENNEPLIALRGLVKEYEGLGGTVVALKGIYLQVSAGEFLVVTGKSGAGKTTLVNMITGLDRSTSGEIKVADTAVHRLGAEKAAQWRGQNVGVVFQSFELLPTLTVLQNVTLPMDFAASIRCAANVNAECICWNRWKSPSTHTNCPRLSRVASSNAWPSPVLWPTTRPS